MSSLTSARRWVGPASGWIIVAPSMLVLIIQGVVAVTAWPPLRAWGLCGEHLLGGQHIGQAIELALLCGFFGTVTLVVLHRNARSVAVALVVLAALLSACVALVMLDSAAFAVRTPGGSDPGDWSCPDKTVTHIDSVSYLYVVWGSTIALLLLQAGRAFAHARLVRETETSHA